MKKNAMRKNLRQSILRSFGRYIAIVMIIALGSGIFVGLLMTKSDMVATGQEFMDEQHMFDLRLMNSYGWTEEYLDAIAGFQGIEEIEAVNYLDLIIRMDNSQEDHVYRFLTIPEKLNRVSLRGGRMPQAANECLIDGYHRDDSILGATVTVQPDNDEDSLSTLTQQSFTVVGYVATPLYMDMNRGTTSVGNGSLSSFLYVQEGVLELDYIPEINITIPGKYHIYTEEYDSALETAAEELECLLQPLAEKRLQEVREEAEKAYNEGFEEYREGLQEYRDKKAEVDLELANGRKELLEAEADIAANEQMLKDAEIQIDEARDLLADSEVTLQESKKTLADSKAAAYQQIAAANAELLTNYKTVSQNLRMVDNGLLQLNAGMVELDAGILQIESGLTQIDSGISQLEMMMGILDISADAAQKALDMLNGSAGLLPDISIPGLDYDQDNGQPDSGKENNQKRQELEAKLAELIATRDQYAAQLEELYIQRTQLEDQLAELELKKEELEAQKEELETNKVILEDAMFQIELGFAELASSQAQMENQFAAADAQIEAGAAQIEAGYKELDRQEQNLADGWSKLEEGRQELADAWTTYEEGRQEAKEEFWDAWLELVDANRELRDARKRIDDMTENEIFVMDRNTNVGYVNLDSASDIVQGVSRVIPAFFLLVASLVCITTMTRMIDEERTQIGTLKALGYGNGAIISKYLLYSGSGAVIGCGIGVFAGSSVFPIILWDAYKIMLYIKPKVVLTISWPLCIAVVVTYTAVLLLVTWYCCRKALQEVPAELIRPKAPDSAQRLLVERFPLWHKLSFLNKVTIRNIFRYRQRLAMMLVGIGGCTALLVTGFGLRDSIVNVVDFQFQDITKYDISVYFRDSVTDSVKESFLQKLEPGSGSLFYHQSSVELDYNDRVKEIYMISAGEEMTEFIDLHTNSNKIPLPGLNEVVLSVGVSEAMGIDVGDSVILRNSDMEVLNLTVSGIYDNYVYNYSIVHPDTIEAQWGEQPDLQMAFVKLPEGADVHSAGAEISSLMDVMNVSVSDDLADMVGSMLEALDLVVVVIVVCAGLLAVIVLYNLTNININERIREIATIKVLGFNAVETAAYVFKENMTLTVVGSVFGFALGYLLLAFVMTQVKIDMVWFKTIILPMSYVWSALLTILSACVVNFIFYFKLDKINMAEALKSVE